MPRTLTSREYDALVQRLERMAEGIAKHKGEKVKLIFRLV